MEQCLWKRQPKTAVQAFMAEAPAPFAKPNWHFEAAGINPAGYRNALFINSMPAVLESVRQGCGIAALPEPIIKKNGLVTILQDSLSHVISLYFVYPEEHKKSKRIALLRDFLALQKAK